MLLVLLVSEQEQPAGPVSPGVVNKTELATILRTSLPTIDRLIRKHGDAFPVVRQGGLGSSYEFDPAAVVGFLQRLEDARIAEGRERDDLVQQYTLPEIIADKEATPSPRDRLMLAKLRQMERDERIRCGFLVEKSELRAVMFTTCVTLRREMDAAVRQAMRSSGVPESVIRTVQSRFHESQRKAILSLQETLRKGDPAGRPGQGTLL